MLDLQTVDLGGPVRYVDFGGEGPPLVAVHGLGASHASWVTVGPALAAAGHRVLALDLPGFGRTPPAGRATTVDAFQRVLDAFLREVAGTPATVIGNSMGGMVGLLQAARHPATLDRLVLVDASLPPPAGQAASIARLLRRRGLATSPPGSFPDPRVLTFFALYSVPVVGPAFVGARRKRLGPARLVDDTLTLCCVHPDRVPADARRALEDVARDRMHLPWADSAFIAAARSIVIRNTTAAPAYRRLIARVSVPTLVLHGDHDRLVPLAAARAAAASNPRLELQVLHDTGHAPQLEAPEAVLDAVLAFLARVPAAAAVPGGA